MCSVFGALNGNLLVAPRLLYAMGEDGLAPRALGAVHPHYRTPALAILIMGGWGAVLVLLAAVLTSVHIPTFSLGNLTIDLNIPPNKSIFDMLTDLAMFGSVTFETMAVASVFFLRWRYPDAERSYRCWGYPVVPALYVLILSLVLMNMLQRQQMETAFGFSFIGVGALVYVGCLRRKTPALVKVEP
jgi:amino acid transporter